MRLCMPLFSVLSVLFQHFRYFLFFSLFFRLTSPPVKAQTNACPEKFLAYNSRGAVVTTFCVGETIRFKSCAATTQPDKEYYDTDQTNGLAFPDTTKSVVYAAPGTYTVTQLINTGLPGVNQFARTFTVVATPPPLFEAFACYSNKINLKITDRNYAYFRVNFGDGVERRVLPGKDTVYQYATAGSHPLTLKAAYRNATCTIENTVTISTLPTPRAPELPRLTITKYAARGTLALEISNGQPEYSYALEQAPAGSATFREVQRVSFPTGAATIPITGVDTRAVYQYRLRVTDGCDTYINVFSNVIRTQPLRIAPENKAVRLNWSPYAAAAEVVNYQVYRDGKLLQTLPAAATSLLDAAVACGRSYCYQLTAVLTNNRFSVSNDTCQVVSARVPPRPGSLTTTFTAANQVELRLQPAANEPVQTVKWQKSLANAAFADLGTSNQPAYLDSAAFQETAPPCYQAFYTDSCGLTSVASAPSCPVVLRAAFDEKASTVNLSWSDYVGFAGRPDYIVEVLDAATNQILYSYPVGSGRNVYTDTKLSDASQILAYRIKATAANASGVSYSNQVRITQRFRAVIPTAFSPNNDGLNDVFEVKGRFINAVRLKIYNRWGQIIFESKSPNEGWNGQVNGQDAPVGTYIFSLEAQDLSGQTITRTGSVTLVK